MTVKFQATIIIVAQGEVDLSGDDINVYTKSPITIIYPLMTPEPLPEGEAGDLVRRVLAHNVVHAALMQMDVPGVTRGVPAPIVDAPPGERS